MKDKKKKLNARAMGHRYERKTRRGYSDAGYSKTITARLGSRLLDNCGIDLMNIPFLVQCKRGYKRGISYKDIFRYIRDNLIENFEKDDKIFGLPIVIHHSFGLKKEENLVVIQEKDWFEIVKKLKKYEEQV